MCLRERWGITLRYQVRSAAPASGAKAGRRKTPASRSLTLSLISDEAGAQCRTIWARVMETQGFSSYRAGWFWREVVLRCATGSGSRAG